MNRRTVMGNIAAGIAASALGAQQSNPPVKPANTFLELKTWRLHNSAEEQSARLAEYLHAGLSPALQQTNGALTGAFSNVIGPDGPYYVTLCQFPSLAAFQEAMAHLAADERHQQALSALSSQSQFPFVGVESSLLRSFDAFPAAAVPENGENRPPRLFELRTYQSQSYLTLARKISMFNHGEMQIFERLKMRPVFFGETIVGPRQPNLTYMLSYDDLAARDELWGRFVSDPAWKALSSHAELRDPEIVANISNVILRPLAFSAIR